METVNQVETGNEAESRTFTQAEVDAIVSDRLKRDRAKYADYDALKEKAKRFDEIEEKSKTELEKATAKAAELQAKVDSMEKADALRQIRMGVAKETGVPVELLSGDTEDECKEQAERILTFAQPPAYPNVRDAGEPKGAPKGSTRQQFADWLRAQ